MGLLEELKEQREKAIALAGKWRKDAESNAAMADAIERKVADLDRAIAALTPAPEAEPGSDALEIPEGFTKWEGGDESPVNPGVPLEIIFRAGGPRFVAYYDMHVVGAHTICSWKHNGEPDDIIAYRVLPSEPAGEEKAADEPAGYQHVVDAEPAASNAIEEAVSPYEYGQRARCIGAELWQNPYPTMENNPLNDPGPSREFVEWEQGFLDEDARLRAEPAPLIIADPSSVEELGEQSEPYSAAHEQDEPAITLDQMDDQGITDPDASAMARMLAPRKLEGVE